MGAKEHEQASATVNYTLMHNHRANPSSVCGSLRLSPRRLVGTTHVRTRCRRFSEDKRVGEDLSSQTLMKWLLGKINSSLESSCAIQKLNKLVK